ncbi:MAG: HAMP domain-containing sensor histidine kinase [Bacteroidetes bacterium]|nr:HAMP domain-containing sensor histidine kinase [Bacteroidota bacterium]
MLQRLTHFKTILALIAILIVSGTIFYSQYIAKKIAFEERLKIDTWAEATRTLLDTTTTEFNNLAAKISTDSMEIPAIMVTEKNEVLALRNVDTFDIKNKKQFLENKIATFKNIHQSIEWKNPNDTTQINIVYYGESKLLNEVRYYPIVQLIIVILFITIVLLALHSNYRSTQNQVWAGLAKETAHQLGTPVSSLEGWVEVLKDIKGNEKIVPEMEKDVHRLQLISDRFGKIGSTPQLEEKDIVQQVQYMMDYIKKRAGHNIKFTLNTNQSSIIGKVSPPLFDWVIENLLKNALDAMEGKGSITVAINNLENKIIIEVTDTGKGISKANIDKVFKPGFTTKKRGWGLGLTLTKRIVEQYHKGIIYVKNSELNKGTTFKIELKK